MSSLPVERVSVAEPIPGERARAAAPAPEPEGGGLSAQASSTPDAAQRTGTLRLVRAALLLLIGAGAHVWLDRWHRPEPPSALASVPIVTQAP
ncbi:MAG TPA: hypothetical protein VNI83_12255, partial [Vicinamibacterales bacterium]|nr:hypothetical protein [Vicinamibacterales bacterium]